MRLGYIFWLMVSAQNYDVNRMRAVHKLGSGTHLGGLTLDYNSNTSVDNNSSGDQT